MTGTPTVAVAGNPDLLAAAVAARLVTRLVDVQAGRGSASLVLTGGGIGLATLAALRDSSARDAIDWRCLDVWWGDERFVPADDPERNEGQARETLLDHVDLDPARVFPIPPADGADGGDPEAAAERYANLLASRVRPEDHAPVPRFDVLLLGVGPDGHVGSVFPGAPAAYDDRQVVAVRNCPKPPPTRVTLTLPAMNAAAEVWLVVSGAEKAEAVAMALGGAGPLQLPASGVRGRSRTLWLLDRAAASRLPAGLARPASP